MPLGVNRWLVTAIETLGVFIIQMKKKLFFKHDYGARNDPKIQDVVFERGGAAGYAWWVIVEKLYEEDGYLPLKHFCERISYEAHCDVDDVKYILEESGLLIYDEERVWSERILEELQTRDEKAESARGSVAERWKKYRAAKQKESETKPNITNSNNERSTDVIRTYNERYTNKEKEKDKEIDIDIIGDSISIESLSDSEPEIRLDDGDLPVKPHSPVDNSWVRDMFNSICVDFPRVTSLSDKRKNKIRLRLEEMNKEGPQKEVLTTVFTKMQASKFMKGDNHSGWKASFDWVFENPTNWVKIYEGNYDDKARNPADAKTDRVTGLSKNINDYWDRKSNGSTD